ncbi:MAG: hypothetical protein AAF481_16880 [Acidobacteriota bacterium]
MMREARSTGPKGAGPYPVPACLLALLLVFVAAPAWGDEPPGKPLTTGSGSDTEKVNEAMDELHCAVDSMDPSDPNRKKAEKALDAALKALKGKKDPTTGQYESRMRKQTLTKKGHDAFTSIENDDGKNVSGTEEVGAGNEYVVLGDHWLTGSALKAGLAGLLAHEGMRLTQKYNYPRKNQSFDDKCGIVNRALDAWGLQIAVLEALSAKETDPDEKKKIDDRIKDANKAKDSWQQNKDALNQMQPGGCK